MTTLQFSFLNRPGEVSLLAHMWPVANAQQGTSAKLVLATKLTAGKLARLPPVLSAIWTASLKPSVSPYALPHKRLSC